MYLNNCDYLDFNSHAFDVAIFNLYLVPIQDGDHFQDGGQYRPAKVYLPWNGEYLADFDDLSVNYQVWKGAEFISDSLMNLWTFPTVNQNDQI